MQLKHPERNRKSNNRTVSRLVKGGGDWEQRILQKTNERDEQSEDSTVHAVYHVALSHTWLESREVGLP